MPKLTYRSKLPRPDDPDILEGVSQLIALGVPMKYAATALGISDWTAYHWRWQGNQALDDASESGSQDTRRLVPEAIFAQSVKEAEAACVVDAVSEWRKAEKSWPAWATLLQRRFPEDFGIRDKLEVQQTTVSLSLTLGPEASEYCLRALAQLGTQAQALLEQGRGAGDAAQVVDASITPS